MKQQALRSVTVISLFLMLTAVSARAQTAGELRFRIPFEFSAGAQKLPAGEYIVRQNSQTSDTVLWVENRRARASAIVVTARVQRPAMPWESQLVFHKYGEQYFLTQVWAGHGEAGRELNESGREQRLRRESAEPAKKNKLLQGAARVETVVLTMRQQ